MKKFLYNLMIILLLLPILGGIGYLGYSYLLANPAVLSNIFRQSGQLEQVTETTAATQPTQQHSGHTQQGTAMQANSALATPDATALAMANTTALALKNKENLDKSVALLNEFIDMMTLDPYAASEKPAVGSANSMGNMNNNAQQKTGMADDMANMQQTQTSNATQTPDKQGNTTINIFPAVSNAAAPQADSRAQNSVMGDMGTRYDAAKMEQLHAGLYKLAFGMQLLEQLQEALLVQAENAGVNAAYPAQYYFAQYTTTLQLKNTLNQALVALKEAADLVNINPYVSQTGLVYDRERMSKIHEGIYTLAKGIAVLNKLGDDMTQQTIQAANTAQSLINAANMATMTHAMPSASVFGNLLNNINIRSAINLFLILLVVIFILALLGYVFSLLKTSA